MGGRRCEGVSVCPVCRGTLRGRCVCVPVCACGGVWVCGHVPLDLSLSMSVSIIPLA